MSDENDRDDCINPYRQVRRQVRHLLRTEHRMPYVERERYSWMIRVEILETQVVAMKGGGSTCFLQLDDERGEPMHAGALLNELEDLWRQEFPLYRVKRPGRETITLHRERDARRVRPFEGGRIIGFNTDGSSVEVARARAALGRRVRWVKL